MPSLRLDELNDDVLHLILDWSLAVAENQRKDELQYEGRREDPSLARRSNLSSVNRHFRWLGLPKLYQSVYFVGDDDLAAFVAVFERNQSLVPFVR